MVKEVTPYAPGPGSLANGVVGTPGMNRTAGDEWQKLADAAGQAREGIARSQMQGAGQMFGMLDQVAGAIGQAIGRHAFAKQSSSNLLNISAVNQKAYEFKSALNKQQNLFQEQYIDDPQNITPALTEMIDNNAPNGKGGVSMVNDRGEPMDITSIMRSARRDPSIGKDPRALAHLQDRLMAIKQEKIDQVDDWSFKTRTNNAHAQVDNVKNNLVQSLSVQTGSMANRLADYQNRMADAEQLMADNLPVLGQQYLSAKRAVLKQEAGFAYIDAGIANIPDAPHEALTHLSDVKNQLNNAQNLGIELDAKSKLTLQGKVDAAENHYVEQLKQETLSHEVEDTAGIVARKAFLSLNSKDMSAQHQAKAWVADQVSVVNQTIKQIQSDATLPDKAKNALVGRYTQQLQKLDGLVTEADNNMKYHESEARRAESDRRRDASDSRRIAGEERRLQREDERAAKAEHHEQSLVIQGEISAMQDELNQLMTEPLRNKKEIIRKAAELAAATDRARDSRHITSTHADRTLKGALTVVKTAAQYREKPGFLWFPSTVERIKPDSAKNEKLVQLQNNQKAYVAAMQKIRQDQAQLQRDDYINANIRGMSTAQRDEFNKIWPLVKADLEKQRFSPEQLEQKKGLVINRIFRDIPHTGPRRIPGQPAPPGPKDMIVDLHPATMRVSGAPAAGFKSPPKPGALTVEAVSDGYANIPKPKTLIRQGNLDLRKRPVVHFGKGMTEANSTPAARRQWSPDQFPPGSVGTEFSVTVSLDDNLYIIPTIFDGKLHSSEEALEHFKRTRQHMGIFRSTDDGIRESSAYAEQLHRRKMDVS